MNYKNSDQNALKVAIFRLKIEKFPIGEGIPPPQTPHPSAPRSSRLRRSTLAPRLQILDPPLTGP